MKQPCTECPFRRKSAPGYLGEVSHNPIAFLQTIEFNPIPCHKVVDWEAPDAQEKAEEESYRHPCIGSLQFLKNSCKLPKGKHYAAMRDAMEQNPNVFQFTHEFINHHSE